MQEKSLQEGIYATVMKIMPDMLHHTWITVEYHFFIGRATVSAHIKTS
jgi:hypothetical protein